MTGAAVPLTADVNTTGAARACPVPGCPKPVRPAHMCCTPHWYLLPRGMRSAIYRAWDNGAGAGSEAYEHWLRVALEYLLPAAP